ncbi:MAG: aminotransferase class III-fold pyridoxal phosphate-dependent enzyme [Planctomycetota bacterium]
MSQATATGMTVGEQIRGDEAVSNAIDTLVTTIAAKNATITDARGPIDGKRESYEAFMERAAAVKGRGLLYPYVGSGAGNGPLIELADGSVKWDMISGIGVHFFGHGDPGLMRASIEASTEASLKHGNLQSNAGAYEFGEALLREAKKNSRLAHAFITTSGAMANESAIKVCYQKHFPASRVLAFKHCFMGRSVTMCQIGDSAAGRLGIPLTTQVDYMPFWNEEAVEKVGGKQAFIDHACWRLQQYIDRYPGMHACFIFELVQGEGGFNVSDRDYLVALMDICKANGIAVWDDEIQSFGRTTRMFAYEYYDLGDYVDVFCVGKMTQACATLYTEEYNPKPGLLSGTFTGAGVEFAAGTQIIDRLADGDYYGDDGRIARHHAEFVKHVRAMADRHPDWFPKTPFVDDIVGGVGGMMRMTPFGGEKKPMADACHALFDEGVIMFYCGHGPFHLRMLPPLGVMKMEDWPRVFERVEAGLARVAATL